MTQATKPRVQGYGFDTGGFDHLVIDGKDVSCNLAAAAPTLLAALKVAVASHWLSIDYEHNRTQEACAIRAMICSAIDLGEKS